MTIKWRLLLAAGLLGLLPAGASAQPPAAFFLEDMRYACAADADRLCPYVIPGRGRIIECLWANEDALRDGCYHAVQIAKTIHVCRVDYYRLCAHVRPGGGRIVRCFERNEPRLSPVCRAQFAKIAHPY